MSLWLVSFTITDKKRKSERENNLRNKLMLFYEIDRTMYVTLKYFKIAYPNQQY